MKISKIALRRAAAAAAAVCVAASALVFAPGGVANVQAADTGISTGNGPVRVVDTRVYDYGFIGRLADGEARQFVIKTAGEVAALIGTSEHVVLNITAVDPVGDGFFTVWSDCNTPRPNASTLNYSAGQTVPNTAIVKLAKNSSICVFSLRAADVVIDVQGAVAGFADAGPDRLVDTRESYGRDSTADGMHAGEGRLQAGETRRFRVGDRVGMPATGTAALNVVAVNPSGPGHLTIWPCGNQRPLASALNYKAATTRANLMISALSDRGDICVFSYAAVDIVIDIAGVPFGVETLTPARLLDSRPGQDTIDEIAAGEGRFKARESRAVKVAGRGGVPLDAAAVVLNVVAVNPDAPGFLTIYPCGQLPVVSNGNYLPGDTNANGAIIPLNSNGEICIYSLASSHVVIDVGGFFAAAEPEYEIPERQTHVFATPADGYPFTAKVDLYCPSDERPEDRDRPYAPNYFVRIELVDYWAWETGPDLWRGLMGTRQHSPAWLPELIYIKHFHWDPMQEQLSTPETPWQTDTFVAFLIGGVRFDFDLPQYRCAEFEGQDAETLYLHADRIPAPVVITPATAPVTAPVTAGPPTMPSGGGDDVTLGDIVVEGPVILS